MSKPKNADLITRKRWLMTCNDSPGALHYLFKGYLKICVQIAFSDQKSRDEF